jgi:hypothetical protein
MHAAVEWSRGSLGHRGVTRLAASQQHCSLSVAGKMHKSKQTTSYIDATNILVFMLIELDALRD